jgi:hypothetical protein
MAVKSIVKPLNGNILVEIQTSSRVNGATLKSPLQGRVVAIDSVNKHPVSCCLDEDSEPLINIGDYVIISSKAEITVIDDQRIMVSDYNIVGIIIPEE